MKKAELIFNLVSIPVDALSLLVAAVASFFLRQHYTNYVGPILFQLDLNQFLTVVYKIIPILLVLFALLGLYNLRGTRSFVDELGKIIIGVSLGLLAVILLFFFNQTIFPSRFIILATWGLGIVLVICGRSVLKGIQIFLFRRGVGLHKLVVINKTQLPGEIKSYFYRPSQGYEIVAELEYQSGVFGRLEELYQNRQVDEILQASAILPDAENLKLVQFARNKGVKFSFVPNLFEVQRQIIETQALGGFPVISLKNTPLDGWGKVSKRLLDVLVSLVCLVITSPIMLFVVIAIRLDSPGRAIYSALRGGRNKDFYFYKFRSMYSHLSVGDGYGGRQAEAIRQELWEKNDRGGKDGPFLKIKNDPRVTRVGRFLRRTKLDEIPQFWNVFIGDMSMVGPRAHVLDEVGRYRDRYPRMFSIKPGVFGLSQIAQVSYPNLPFEEEIRLNTFYIENWSLWLDVKILAKIFWLLFFAPKPHDDY